MSEINAKDLTKIIKACKESGVTRLKIGAVEMEFAPREPVKLTGDAVLVPTAEQLTEAEDRALLVRDVEDREDHLAHMAVEDPARLEELLVQRELEVGDTQTGH